MNDTQKPPTVSLGNPDLKAEHGNNFDLFVGTVLLSPLGLIQAGVSLTKPGRRSDHRHPGWPDHRTVCGDSSCRSLAMPAARRFQVSKNGLSAGSPGPSCRDRSRVWACSASYGYTTSQARGPAIPNGSPSAPATGTPHLEYQPDATIAGASPSVRAGLATTAPTSMPTSIRTLNDDGTPMTAGDLTAGGTDRPRRRQLSVSAFPARRTGDRARRERTSPWWCTV